MPIIKSAKKRVKVARKAAVRNSKTRRALKSSLKTLAKKAESKTLNEVNSNIDKAVKKGVIHKNKAARLKARAALTAKTAGVKPTKSTKNPAKKPAAKKPAAKTAKKPTTKKSTIKKSTQK